ncbi:MAG: helix-turn-helix transcriptional regulator [Microthrixaceae bacterium]|nr:helix-turn-helix transcriptional regulator [Microthrixaceae bacterium]
MLDMRRGTPSAKLFGDLLSMLRTVGTGQSMRQVGDRIGVRAATISQIEKGQRALKEPKIAMWADALDVSEVDLRELWMLSQGQIQLGDRRVFYTEQPDALDAEPLNDSIEYALEQRPDLRPLYLLAQRIATVLDRLVPEAGIRIRPDDHDEPPHVSEPGDAALTEAQKEENVEWADTYPLPVIERTRGGTPLNERRFEYEEGELVRVPPLRKQAAIVRRRGKSMGAPELVDLFHELTGPERERVRGYIDAIIDQRTAVQE